MATFETTTIILAACSTVTGNKLVYEIEKNKLVHPLYKGQDRNGLLISFGTLLAVKNGGIWYNKRGNRASWSERVTDNKTLAMLESVPFV